MKKRTKIILIGLPILLILLVLPGLYNALKIVPYTLHAKGVTESIRIALVTDLHSCDYGENMRDLLDALNAQAPDLVLLGGIFLMMNYRTTIQLHFFGASAGVFQVTM